MCDCFTQNAPSVRTSIERWLRDVLLKIEGGEVQQGVSNTQIQ